jgi:hypothetical protein
MWRLIVTLLCVLFLSGCGTAANFVIDQDYKLSQDDNKGIVIIGMAPGKKITALPLSGDVHASYNIVMLPTAPDRKPVVVHSSFTDKNDGKIRYVFLALPTGNYVLDKITYQKGNVFSVNDAAVTNLRIQVKPGEVLYIGDFYVDFYGDVPFIYKWERNDAAAQSSLDAFSGLPRNFSAANDVKVRGEMSPPKIPSHGTLDVR